jgi:hypothetical protein
MCKGKLGNPMEELHYCVNDNTNVDLENPQIIHYILCFNNLVNATNPRTQSRKGLISYYKTNGITFF